MKTNLSTNEMAGNAKKACIKIANVDTKTKNQLLLAISDRIKQSALRIKECNEQDVQIARELLEKGELSKPLLNRLILTDDKIEQLSTYLEEVAKLEDPVGKRQFAMKLANGLELERVTCPIGLIAIIFESRPEVVIQVTALSLKSGNGVILKGGAEAANTNRVLFEIINEVLEEFDLSNTVNLIETRGDVAELLKQDTFVDLIIPRGSNSFVKYIQDNTRIPVLGHSSGICHIYVDSEYDSEMAIPLILDAKLDYPSACNAVETLLVNQNVAEQLIPEVIKSLQNKEVKVLGCGRTTEIAKINNLTIENATEKDWLTEYTDLILSIRIVESTNDAVDHVNTYGSHHTDSIITTSDETAAYFLQQVDSACVFHNASTRFSDGYVFGLGAEVGISTNKTHSRGPVGLDGMIIYKYLLKGEGHMKGSFSGPNAQTFIHEPID